MWSSSGEDAIVTGRTRAVWEIQPPEAKSGVELGRGKGVEARATPSLCGDR